MQIASVAEEVKDPGYTMPRSIIGSVIIITIHLCSHALCYYGYHPLYPSRADGDTYC